MVKRSGEQTGRKLARAFYERDAALVARELIGKVMVHRPGERGKPELRARIVETEAYIGPHDLACHAAKGRTKRTEVMFGAGGHAYVYFIYGMHEMFNIVTGTTGDAQAVLVRAAEPLSGWQGPVNLSGPGRFARGMGITRADNARDLTGSILFIEDVGPFQGEIITGMRVGVDYAGHWAAELLRFCEKGNEAVSKPWPWKNKRTRATRRG